MDKGPVVIISVTPNPARDLTYRVPQLQIGASHRVSTVGERAGGKGMNCAGVLASMGRAHRALAVVGETDADWWQRDTLERGVATTVLTAAPPHRVRLSTAIVQRDHEVTVLNEQGVAPPPQVWRDLVEAALDGVSSADVIAVCGSLPAQADAGVLAEIVHRAREIGTHVLVDGSGPWLPKALAARPVVVKVNAQEAAEATGVQQPVAAARRLLRLGAGVALVTDGRRGVVLAVDQDGPVLTARLPTTLAGNPTGAGDAMTAALCAALEGRDLPCGLAGWHHPLRTAVAWAAAAVLHPLAGTVDPRDVASLLPTVIIEESQ